MRSRLLDHRFKRHDRHRYFPDPARSQDTDAIGQLIQRFCGSGYHPCGTAKMGDPSDAMSVVNEWGQLHRLDQVMVADASIMPPCRGPTPISRAS